MVASVRQPVAFGGKRWGQEAIMVTNQHARGAAPAAYRSAVAVAANANME
ncbi:MAG: hypothetical protein M1115_10715 [Actinobacteria bacterium]|nr:hypothetical protein [Actinomycetota bacterium]